MGSVPSLKGKTLFIIGASRGIGLARTTDPNPKLPGTIYSAAEAVQAAGG